MLFQLFSRNIVRISIILMFLKIIIIQFFNWSFILLRFLLVISMVMNFRTLFMLMTFLRFRMLKSLFFIDFFGLIELYHIFFKLNIEKRFFILTDIYQLLFKWNFAGNFSRDHHIENITQTVKIKHKLVFLYE